MDDKRKEAEATLADERKLTEQSRAEYEERMKGKPTPTQEENDLAALGAHIREHEADGSPPDLHGRTKQAEPKTPSSGSYQTRQSEPRQAARHSSAAPQSTGSSS